METHFFGRGRLVTMGMQPLVSGVGLGAILVRLVRMKEAGARRDREIDARAAAFNQQGRALERQGQLRGFAPDATPFPLPPDKGD